MRTGEAIADIDRHGMQLAEILRATIDPIGGGLRLGDRRVVDAAAHQLVWRRYMVTGEAAFGDAVVASLRAILRALSISCGDDGDRHAEDSLLPTTLGATAQLLELSTWVWRENRCLELRRGAEALASSAIARLRRPGFGFAADLDGGAPRRVDWNGLMLVALIEAGSVFERRDWLALARDVFDELAPDLADEAIQCRGEWERTREDAAMSRAACRLFEAFGKPRYLALAEAWANRTEVRSATPDTSHAIEATLASADAQMVGVLARLHALTGNVRYAERARRLVDALHRSILQSGIGGATAIANVQTFAQLVRIDVSGDPKLAETRALMRVALDHALPDRLVLGPGAGGPANASAKAEITVGARHRITVTTAAQLRPLTAPGGLARVDGADSTSKDLQDC